MAEHQWWMYHGGPDHSGRDCGSGISSLNASESLRRLHSLQLGGPVLAVPAIVDGFAYIGVANYHKAAASNGGAFHKIALQSGEISATYAWDIPLAERDTHGFTGMGCTPAVTGGKVYFSAFNGKFYCLRQHDLTPVWVTDLRHADPAHGQPVENTLGDPSGAPAAGWSSPVVVNGRVYVGMGEGENPDLYSFVYCLDAETGNVVWIFCTCQFEAGRANRPNELPEEATPAPVPSQFTLFYDPPVIKGCSVWSSIAYDPDLDRLYFGTGNQQPEPTQGTPSLPSAGYSNGLMALDAKTGELRGFFQVPAQSSYRPSDWDIDVGGSPTIFMRDGRKIVGIGCKNGAYFLLDAATLELINWRQLLPYHQDWTQVATVDPHADSNNPNQTGRNPVISNEESNVTQGENYSGIYGTAAVDPATGKLFICIGGPNYHDVAPGIDYVNTPFMRAVDWNTLADAWPLDDHSPRRYALAIPPMYARDGECGLSSPAVVNDMVFCSTSALGLYGFRIADGLLLWQDVLGTQTGGMNGGYGYCLGIAAAGDYLVAGGLIYGRDGGVLNIYRLEKEKEC